MWKALDVLRVDRPVALAVAILILLGSVALIVILTRRFRKKEAIRVRNEHEEENLPVTKDGGMKP